MSFPILKSCATLSATIFGNKLNLAIDLEDVKVILNTFSGIQFICCAQGDSVYCIELSLYYMIYFTT